MFSRLLGVTLVALFSLSAIVTATPADVGRLLDLGRRDGDSICGTEPSPDAVSAMENSFSALLAENPISNEVNAEASFTVQVLFHVIYDPANPSQGSVSDGQLQTQIQVLNQEFGRFGLNFQAVGVERVPNQDWFYNIAPGTQKEYQMKNQLRRGNVQTLNVYTLALREYLGYATFPANYNQYPWQDGVLLHFTALPGGSAVGLNTGRILVHEVGHWVGLYHTFEGGCNGAGDYVDDTPAEASPASGCPIGRDTCPSPGLDPINNHMDYSNDACRNTFTRGQINRLAAQLYQYRGINLY